MTTGAFVCERCGTRFTLPAATLARYPNWTPRLCRRCSSEAPARAAHSANRASGGARPSGRPALLTPEQVLARFDAGPATGVFTDGSCSGNPGPGGWGAVRVQDGHIMAERFGSDPRTTNNRMEFTAMIEGLLMVAPDEAVDVYSDSRLVVQTLTSWAAGWERRGWKRSGGEVKNLDLVQRAYALAAERPRVRIQWIRAHDGSRWNEYADALATAYMRDRPRH